MRNTEERLIRERVGEIRPVEPGVGGRRVDGARCGREAKQRSSESDAPVDRKAVHKSDFFESSEEQADGRLGHTNAER